MKNKQQVSFYVFRSEISFRTRPCKKKKKKWNGKFWNSIGLLLWCQMTYNVARYCQIFSDLVQCCAILYNIVKYCLILSNIVQYCLILFKWRFQLSLFWVVIIFLKMLWYWPILLRISWYCQALYNIVWCWPVLSSGTPCENIFRGLCPSCMSVTNFLVKSNAIVLYKLG